MLSTENVTFYTRPWQLRDVPRQSFAAQRFNRCCRFLQQFKRVKEQLFTQHRPAWAAFVGTPCWVGDWLLGWVLSNRLGQAVQNLRYMYVHIYIIYIYIYLFFFHISEMCKEKPTGALAKTPPNHEPFMIDKPANKLQYTYIAPDMNSKWKKGIPATYHFIPLERLQGFRIPNPAT